MPKKKSDKITQPDPNKSKALDIAIEQLRKQFGQGAIMTLGKGNIVQVDAIPTGSIALDLALGIGGFPRGRINEIYGPEASGKTTICLHIIANAQKAGGKAAFIDAEHALDPIRAKLVGVDLDNLLIAQPDSGEQALEIVETLVRSSALDVIVVDSVAALVPQSELEGEMGDSSIGVQARLMSRALRKLTALVAKSKTSLIFTNQIRHKIGIMFGNPETTSGGLALKFYASVRVDLRKIANIKKGDKIVGSRHRAKIVKNKLAPPFRIVEFDITNEEGISYLGGLIDTGLEMGILSRSGAFIRWDDSTLGQGKQAAKLALSKDSKLQQKLEQAIRQKASQANPDD
ncbi:MAG: recombinase RecA [bacterium]|nr:recombinase RecA [bacterium]